MLPSEAPESILPKSVLRYVYPIKVLKAGLGVTSELEVREWFHDNPQFRLAFSICDAEIRDFILQKQHEVIEGLKVLKNKEKMQVDLKIEHF